MNSRAFGIPFPVVCFVFFFFLASVHTVHAGTNLTIAEPAKLNSVELSSTIISVDLQSNYLTTGGKTIQMVPLRKGAKQPETILISDLTGEETGGIDTTGYYSHQVIADLIALKQKIAKKLSIVTGGRYEIDDYSIGTGVPERISDFCQPDAEIAYQITKWLSAGISYTYKERKTSNITFADYEYKNNQTMFNITGSF